MLYERSLEYRGTPYVLQLRAGDSVVVRPGQRWCANPRRNPELRGDVRLVLREGKIVRDRILLEEVLLIREDTGWRTPDVPLRVLAARRENDTVPYVSFPRYAGCNGFDHVFFRPGTDETGGVFLERLTFEGEPTRRGVYGRSVTLRTGPRGRDQLWVRGYDNAVLGSFRKQYRLPGPDGRACRLIGLYSRAGGAVGEFDEPTGPSAPP